VLFSSELDIDEVIEGMIEEKRSVVGVGKIDTVGKLLEVFNAEGIIVIVGIIDSLGSEDGIIVIVGIIDSLGDNDGTEEVGILDIVIVAVGASDIDGYCDPETTIEGNLDTFDSIEELITVVGCDDETVSGSSVGGLDSQQEHCTFGLSPLLSADSRSTFRPSPHKLRGTTPLMSFSSNFSSTIFVKFPNDSGISPVNALPLK